jgi:hypothetical protein
LFSLRTKGTVLIAIRGASDPGFCAARADQAGIAYLAGLDGMSLLTFQ